MLKLSGVEGWGLRVWEVGDESCYRERGSQVEEQTFREESSVSISRCCLALTVTSEEGVSTMVTPLRLEGW